MPLRRRQRQSQLQRPPPLQALPLQQHVERAAAPIDRPLAVDDWSKSVSPYPFGAA